jgi:hypothetical protein
MHERAAAVRIYRLWCGAVGARTLRAQSTLRRPGKTDNEEEDFWLLKNKQGDTKLKLGFVVK